MHNFVGIDFEYANNNSASICSYGLAWADGTREHGYIQLHESCSEMKTTWLHGVTKEASDSGITFPEFYEKIKSLVELDDQIVFVAHSLKSDRRAWLAALRLFDLPPLNLTWVDSLSVAKAEIAASKEYGKPGVKSMAERYGIEIDHHNPADDAMISVEILKRNPEFKLSFVRDAPKRPKPQRPAAK